MLETLNLKRALAKPVYSKQMKALQERLRLLQYAIKEAKVPIVICLEGWDTSGKGLVVKKLVERLDPRLFRIHPGTPPSPLEARYHFLWRYQVALPNDSEMAVFDHSWYGRVLVERCDKIVKRRVWRDAYQQINEFERWLADDGQVLIKFWLHISRKEQAKRFKKCLADPLLRWKITKEYKRHHRQYQRWYDAVEEMLARTHTPHAPWTLVEAEDTRWARVKVFETLVGRMEKELAHRNAKPEDISRSAAAMAARPKPPVKAKRKKEKEEEAPVPEPEAEMAEVTHA